MVSRTMVSRFLSTYPGFRYGEGGVEKYRTRRVFLGYSFIVNGVPLGTDLVPSLDLRLLHVCIVESNVCFPRVALYGLIRIIS